jgi:uncharacterized protein (TIGR03086 family)
MTDRATAALIGGVALLERAMGYTLGSLQLVTSSTLRWPTPCAGWDVQAMLIHMADSLDVLCAAVDAGHIDDPSPVLEHSNADALVSAVRGRACRLLGAWAGADEPDVVSIYGQSLSRTIVATTGAIEVAVHGWDLARGCGHDRTIPAGLAEDLGQLAPLVVTHQDRPHRFGYPIAVPRDATPSDRLVAFLGRDPVRSTAK